MTTFFRLYFRNCKSCVYIWDDILPLNSSLRIYDFRMFFISKLYFLISAVANTFLSESTVVR